MQLPLNSRVSLHFYKKIQQEEDIPVPRPEALEPLNPSFGPPACMCVRHFASLPG